MSNKKRICINKDCEKEYNLSPRKPGKINTCWQCGEEEDSGNEFPGGTMEYECKTNGVLKITTLSNAQSLRRKMDRAGGQGIVRGMNTKR